LNPESGIKSVSAHDHLEDIRMSRAKFGPAPLKKVAVYKDQRNRQTDNVVIHMVHLMNADSLPGDHYQPVLFIIAI